MSLTRTQASALVELRVHEKLWPSRTAFASDTGHRAFSRRTLQALVDTGFARWEHRDGVMPHVVLVARHVD